MENQSTLFDASEQLALPMPTGDTARSVLKRIRSESRDTTEKGRWFEMLVAQVLKRSPDFDIEEVWRWGEWPQREEQAGTNARDLGIDLVARYRSGDIAAIQCKCYDRGKNVTKRDMDTFLGGSQDARFDIRLVVATTGWAGTARDAVANAHPPVRQIDFNEHLDVMVDGATARRPIVEPWPLQERAIEDTIAGLDTHERGKLVMACGTGKTFTALRVAEQVVKENGRVLFVAPSIALVSQARREWLRYTTRPLECIVVCSDHTAGGRNESEDIGVSELECPVITDPKAIAHKLAAAGGTRVVFSTYQSLRLVIDALADGGVPGFDLAIADEAHRTTGAVSGPGSNRRRLTDFQAFHDGLRLRARKRLYMTATPRIYSRRSKGALERKGISVVDMNDHTTYGHVLHVLPFKTAVEKDMLCDYRVIVLGVHQGAVTPGLERRLSGIADDEKARKRINRSDMTRVLGVSLAINGVTKGEEADQPGRLERTLGFANSIARSKWFAKALEEPEVLSATTRRMRRSGEQRGAEERAMSVTAHHLDASSSAYKRNLELRELAGAAGKNACRVVTNVRLFTEGVDVPSLEAVAFLDPRDSQVDIVQAVGRVMRRSPETGKRYGYIIVPVVVDPGRDLTSALEKGSEGYETIGRVLRALQSHDSRLAEDPERFVTVYEATGANAPSERSGAGTGDADDQDLQRALALEEAEQGIYAHVVAASGLGRPGTLVADEISDTVKAASSVFQREGLDGALAEALDLTAEADGGAKGVCTIAALLLCNACLLQRRLRDEPSLPLIMRLEKVIVAKAPLELLTAAWETILQKDYAPVFRPALSALKALGEGTRDVEATVRSIAERANQIADSLSDLGYDHAGPLYHRILGSAKSDGAFYTNNVSAIMLAHLALSDDVVDWSDPEAVGKLRIIDPACGTGTLLMAALKTIKDKVSERANLDEDGRRRLHKRLVEDVLCGLDINQHAVQLAACNLTLGAPTVDYKQMNLVTMPHGPQADGTAKAGSLEMLTASDGDHDTLAMFAKHRSLESLEGTQVDDQEEIRFPLHGVDMVIMNPPFTANDKRSMKYGERGRHAMQQHELALRDAIERRDNAVGGVVTDKSIQTFFTPLAEKILARDGSTLAMVIATTVCTGSAALPQRRFLAKRFHIDTVITSHDPKRPNFSENTGIHESLLICRRRTSERCPDTQFVSLRQMPETAEEGVEAARAIAAGQPNKWGTLYEQNKEMVENGDWRPCQFLDPALIKAAMRVERQTNIVQLQDRYRLGPAGQRIRDAFKPADSDEGTTYRVFWGRSKDLRTTMEATPEQSVRPTLGKENLAARYKNQAGYILLAAKFNTQSGRLLAIRSADPTVGSMWIPIQQHTTSADEAKALCAWCNSTLGALGFLMRRASTLANPSFSQAELATLPVPDSKRTDFKPLTEAYELMKRTPVRPWREAANDELRIAIDTAAASAAGIDIALVTEWRERLALEPTITGQRAA